MEHLKFIRVQVPEKERRKKKGFGPKIQVDNYHSHGQALITQIQDNIDQTKSIIKKFSFSPYLVVKVELEKDCQINDEIQEKLDVLGMKVIDMENKELAVLFASDIELKHFKSALDNYKNGIIAKKRIENEDLFEIIKSVSRWGTEDRKGEGLEKLEEIDYVDCYLWVFDSYDESLKKEKEFESDLEKIKVKVCDRYISSSVVVVRLKVSKAQLETILEHPLVYKIDRIPTYILKYSSIQSSKKISIDQLKFDNSGLDPDNSSSICVIDSGIFKGHPLLKGAVGDSKTFYATEGYSPSDNDIDGHGTEVASICEYGNIDISMPFIPKIYLYNAKIHDGIYKGEYELCKKELNESGFNLDFDQQEYLYNYFISEQKIEDLMVVIKIQKRQNEFRYIVKKYTNIYEKLWPNQMVEIVKYFYDNYNCRIFNLSQGDLDHPYHDNKPRAWTCVLDEIQNELDILFVVSSGNFNFKIIGNPDEILKSYPRYFFENNECRIIDPANSANSITVGSLAVDNVPIAISNDKYTIVPITKKDQVSSITRVGPGINGSIKPDFVAYGGDLGIHVNIGDFVTNSGLGRLLFTKDFMNGLFCYDCGTSYAAPYISHIAAEIENKYRDFSNNLVRAIIASSAYIPNEIENLLEDKVYKQNCVDKLQSNYTRNHCGKMIFDKTKVLHYLVGYGMPDIGKCLDSQENRVVLYADMNNDQDEISPDVMHIFEIPVPEVFKKSRGKKRIIVTLAFNPQVRKTRLDYTGISMSFTLIRGKSVEEVYNVFTSQAHKEKKEKMFDKKYICDMKPGIDLRSKCTLQKGVFEFSKDEHEYGENYYLVVNCIKNWSEEKQKYALVVVLETDDKIEMYDIIKQRVRIPQRIRV